MERGLLLRPRVVGGDTRGAHRLLCVCTRMCTQSRMGVAFLRLLDLLTPGKQGPHSFSKTKFVGARAQEGMLCSAELGWGWGGAARRALGWGHERSLL